MVFGKTKLIWSSVIFYFEGYFEDWEDMILEILNIYIENFGL